jgi:hypothetical protein
MFIPLLISLTLAGVATLISFKVTEEVEHLGANLIAILCLLLSLCFAPLWLKGLILLFLLINHTSTAILLQESRY